MSFKNGLVYGINISIIIFIMGIFHHFYYHLTYTYGIRMRNACMGLLYRKSNEIPLSRLNSDATGKMINLIANDSFNIEYILHLLPYLLIAPIQTIIVIYILLNKVNLTFLSGLLIILLFFPIQFISGKILSFYK